MADHQLAKYTLDIIQCVLDQLPQLFESYKVPKENQNPGAISFSVHESGNIRLIMGEPGLSVIEIVFSDEGKLTSAYRTAKENDVVDFDGNMIKRRLAPMK